MSYEKQVWSKYDALKPEEENIENGAVVTDSRMNHMEEGIESNDNNFTAHSVDKNNPHKVTATQVGLGNVQNFGLATENEAKQGASNANYMTPSLTQAVLSANINSIAYANSADGTDGFTVAYPDLNLLDGTKDFSGDWGNVGPWYKNGTYNGLTVMSFNTGWNAGLVKSFTIPSDGTYSMSMLVKVKTGSIGQFVIESTGKPAYLIDVTDTGGKFVTQSYTGTFTSGQTILMYFRFNNGKNVIKDGLSVAGHKIEHGSIATPYMPSSSEATTADYPKFVGFSNTVKTNKSASDYTWFPDLTNKVEDHVNNKSNPHGVTASQVGSYTKSEVATLISEAIKQSKLDANPIGTILTTISGTNPSTYLGGTWIRYANGRTLVGVDESDSATLMKSANNEGGSTNPLTRHSHNIRRSNGTQQSAIGASISWSDLTNNAGVVQEAGDNTDHNNWQPFVTVYFWRRTA